MLESFDIIEFLKKSVGLGASDEHLQVGEVPYIRKNGFISRFEEFSPLSKEDLDRAVMSIAPSSLIDEIATVCDLDFMYEIKIFIFFR